MKKISLYLTALAAVHALCLHDTLAATLQVPSQFPTIQSAVDAAVNGDEIVVAPGVYAAGFNYNGKRLTVRSSGGAATTIIDLTATGGTAVRALSAEQIGTRLVGFTLTGATTSAILVGDGATLDISGCSVKDCLKSQDPLGGSAIQASGATVLVSNCEFVSCRVQAASKDYAAKGGAISIQDDTSLVVVSSVFLNCTAANDFGAGPTNFDLWSIEARGGAIAAVASEMQVEGCSFDGCMARSDRPLADGVFGCDLGKGYSRACGGAISLDSASIGTIRSSNFGLTGACRASATTRRPPISAPSQFRSAVAQGGAIYVRAGSRLVTDQNRFTDCYAIARAGTEFSVYQCSSGVIPPAELFAEGGAIYVDGGGATNSLTMVGDDFDGPSCRSETFVASGSGDPAPSVATTLRGSHILVRPVGSTTQITGAEFKNATHIALMAESGVGVSLSQSVFSGNAPHGLAAVGNAVLVSACQFRATGGNPITSYGGGSGPNVLNSLFCQNSPNTIFGPWIDGGGNEFAKACITNDCNNNNIEDTFEIQNGSVPDCNANDVPDSCDIASKSSEDCDENEIPDECQFRATNVSSPSLSPVQSGTTLTHSFQGLASAGTDVVISVLANADLSSATETIQVKAGGALLGTLFQTGGADCTPVTGELLVSKDTFNGLLTKGGTLSLQFVPSFAVTAGTCNPSSLVATVEYQPSVPGDCNGNSLPDICDILAGTEQDVNGDWIPDSCQDLPTCPADINLDGEVGAADMSLLLAAWDTASSAADVNGDGSVNAQDLGLMLAAWGACP